MPVYTVTIKKIDVEVYSVVADNSTGAAEEAIRASRYGYGNEECKVLPGHHYTLTKVKESEP